MSPVDNYDILIIGSGEAGKWLAWTTAEEGRRTAVVERKLIGGSCPNIACMPSKNVIHSAKVRSFISRAAEFGVDIGSATTQMSGVQARKRAMVERERQAHLNRFKATGVELIMGDARFIEERTVHVDLVDGGNRQLRGDQVFLDLGTHATIPDVPGLAGAHPMTHVELLDLERLPEHLIVIGGGYVGLELAQAMRRFGSQVTVIEAGSQLASREDPDIGAELKNLLVDEGMEVLLGAAVSQVEGRSGDQVRVHVGGASGNRVIEGTDLLVATGRKANTDGVGLELTGVEVDSHGFVKVNDRLETTAPNIWAMGDCAGSPQFTHVAYDDFRLVHDNLNGGNRTTKNRLIPFCMFTDPELARVGLNETEARRDGIEYRLVKMPIANVLRTRTVSETRGLMKMLIAKDSDEILGFTALGFEASELMAAVQTAMLGHLP